MDAVSDSLGQDYKEQRDIVYNNGTALLTLIVKLIMNFYMLKATLYMVKFMF